MSVAVSLCDLRVLFDEGDERVLVLNAHELFDLLAVGKEREHRDALDVELRRDVLVCVDVDLRDGRRGFRGDRLDGGFEHLARSTPVRVEVDEHDGVVPDDLVEVVVSLDVDRLLGRSELRLQAFALLLADLVYVFRAGITHGRVLELDGFNRIAIVSLGHSSSGWLWD